MAYRCKACSEPLVLQVDMGSDYEGDEETLTVPDDLELRCGCHFHWQCLFDKASEVAISLKCPSCQTHLPTNEQGPSVTNPFLPTSQGSSIPARYVNEGGIEDNLDLLPSITEEAYLAAHPEARLARAFHVMCIEGDVGGIVELLHDASQELAGDRVQLGHLLRYRDPLASGKSGLHLAIENGQEEVAWLLLWLASGLPEDVFPTNAQHVAQSLHIQRIDIEGDDIRSLRTDGGESAEDIAREKAGRWLSLVDSGVLSG